MKDRILNILMLLSVSAALLISFLRGSPKDGQSVSVSSLPSLSVQTPSPLAAYRARRAEERKAEMEVLLSLSRNEVLEKESREEAGQRLLYLQRFTEAEMQAEALLTGRGYGETLCIADEKNLLIVLEHALNADQAQQILSLLEEILAYPGQNIRIIC